MLTIFRENPSPDPKRANLRCFSAQPGVVRAEKSLAYGAKIETKPELSLPYPVLRRIGRIGGEEVGPPAIFLCLTLRAMFVRLKGLNV
jgi:hypothetical protein